MAETTKTILAHGVFDVIHHGHIAFLEAAAKLGDELIVSITADRFVNKGPNRPVFTAEQRSATLMALRCVDRVLVSESISAVDIINQVNPAYYVKGVDYHRDDTNGMLQAETNAVLAGGGVLKILNTPPDSSSRAINIDRPTIPEDAQKWVAEFKQKYSWADVASALAHASSIELSVVGERIIDRYEYVEASGRSPKEGYTTYMRTGVVDEWEGGIGVIRDHVARISPRSGCPASIAGFVVTKTRYVEHPFLKKVFSSASISDTRSHVNEYTFGSAENRIIADFGHGLFDDAAMTEIYRSSEWIAATIQANSLNFGFNRMNKWGKLNYISCDRTELELANPMMYSQGYDHAAEALMKQHQSDAMALTLGHEGAVLFYRMDERGPHRGGIRIPAFNTDAVDRIGAGDAWFGWTAPLVRAAAPAPVIAFVGACAAAVHISTVGNRAAKTNEVMGFMKATMA